MRFFPRGLCPGGAILSSSTASTRELAVPLLRRAPCFRGCSWGQACCPLGVFLQLQQLLGMPCPGRWLFRPLPSAAVGCAVLLAGAASLSQLGAAALGALQALYRARRPVKACAAGGEVEREPGGVFGARVSYDRLCRKGGRDAATS